MTWLVLYPLGVLCTVFAWLVGGPWWLLREVGPAFDRATSSR